MTSATWVRGGLFTALLVAVPFMGLQHWILNMLILVLMYVVLALVWNWVGGFAGYPSLGHAGFFGIGAYALMIHFQNHNLGNGYGVFAYLPIVFLICFAVGIPIGWVSMRTRSDVFAIVTITFLFVVQALAQNLQGLTGGSQGLTLFAPFNSSSFERPFYIVLAGLTLLAMFVTYYIMRSKVGLSLVSIRADEDKALGVGVRTTFVKVLVFGVSVGITGIVGAIWAYYEGQVYPVTAVDPLLTISMVLMTFLGGRGTLWGPIIGAVILESSHQVLAYQFGNSMFYLVAYALVFIVIIRLLPRGIVPTIQEKLRLRRRRLEVDATKDASGLVPDAEPVTTSTGGAA
jgi:branched-chain amino acid transport system permease protein